MESASTLANLVQLNLKGCPEVAAMAALRKAFDSLCRETGCWRKSIVVTAAGVEAGQIGRQRMEIKLAALKVEAGIDRIRGVDLRPEALIAVANGWTRLPDGMVALVREEKTYIDFPWGQIEDGDEVRLDLALHPSASTGLLDGLPESIMDLCAETIVPMASAALAGQSKRPWTDPDAKRDMEIDARVAKARLLRNLSISGSERPERSEVVGIVEG